MTYDARETSIHDAAPLEFYRFAYGDKKFFYSSSDVDVTYLGDLYTSEILIRTGLSQADDQNQGGLEITLPRTNPVAQLFIPYIPEPELEVTIYRQHRGDAEVRRYFKGKVNSCALDGAEAKLTCMPRWRDLDRQVPKNTFQAQCNWALYSPECTLLASNFAVAGKVSLISGDTVQVTAFSAKPDGWFNNGWIERASGERRWILNHVGPTLTLMTPFIGLAVNEDVTAYAGCDRTESVCKNKFNNIVNFLGFPRIPNRNPFTVGLE